jgi:hypothetical protein
LILSWQLADKVIFVRLHAAEAVRRPDPDNDEKACLPQAGVFFSSLFDSSMLGEDLKPP